MSNGKQSRWRSLSVQSKALIGTVIGIIGTLSLLLTNTGNICDRLGFAWCINDTEQSATITDIKLEHRMSLGEYRNSQADQSQETETPPDSLGIGVFAQVTVKGYEGQRVTLDAILLRASDGQRMSGPLTEPTNFVARAPTVSRVAEMWIEAPQARGSFVVKVELSDESGTTLAFARSEPVEWPLPVPPVNVATPRRVIQAPFDPRFTSTSQVRPRRISNHGYWARVSFRYLGEAACEKGGADFPCYLPLRTAPDFRDSLGRPVTETWPADGKHWVWVECQADGNGVANEGLLENAQGTKSNRWNLIALGEDKSGIPLYAWGNDLWFLPKGPLADDGNPQFACSEENL